MAYPVRSCKHMPYETTPFPFLQTLASKSPPIYSSVGRDLELKAVVSEFDLLARLVGTYSVLHLGPMPSMASYTLTFHLYEDVLGTGGMSLRLDSWWEIRR
jgi:hypothetical protein